MELIRNSLVNVSIIWKNGERILLKPSEMSRDIIEKKVEDASKSGAEIRWYYLPKTSFEVIKTILPPGREQPLHSHHKLHEATLVLKGQLTILEEREGKRSEEILREGDFVVFNCDQRVYHTMKNSGPGYAYTLTFKFLGPDVKNAHLFKTDWHGK